jgi:hypothetical protein
MHAPDALRADLALLALMASWARRGEDHGGRCASKHNGRHDEGDQHPSERDGTL